jgi:hypothetical protein
VRLGEVRLGRWGEVRRDEARRGEVFRFLSLFSFFRSLSLIFSRSLWTEHTGPALNNMISTSLRARLDILHHL